MIILFCGYLENKEC